MSNGKKIIGIDLGTTNSVAAYVEGGQPVVIPNPEGGNKTPSVVAFLENGDVLVGELARRQAATNPKKTIYSAKRLIGRSYDDIEASGDVFTYDVVNQDDRILIDINGMGYRPEQISALVLRKLKESAEQYLNEEVSQAIITVPAYFDDMQRTATMEAAKMAGLDVLRLLNEPTAAALAYGLGKGSEELVAVYDFGGGTFDISILEIADNTIEVLTSTGDSLLGGDDLDNAIVRRILDEFQAQHGIDLAQDPVTLRRLKEVCEKAKCELSSMTQTMISLPFIAMKGSQQLHLERLLRRNEFEALANEFIDRTIDCCRRAVSEASLKTSDITRVILVGGSSRIPMVREAVEDFFGVEPFKGVNPDEIVAMGAAAQAGILEGHLQEVTLLDVTPHSMGIEVKNGKFSKIIEKNSTIPIKAAKTFTTTENNQTFVNIHVLQGEAENSADNRSLGKVVLSDIPPAAAGQPRIRVTFFINSDGVMEITAMEMGTGQEKSLKILHSDLSDEEMNQRRKKRTSKRGKASIGARRAGSLGSTAAGSLASGGGGTVTGIAPAAGGGGSTVQGVSLRRGGQAPPPGAEDSAPMALSPQGPAPVPAPAPAAAPPPAPPAPAPAPYVAPAAPQAPFPPRPQTVAPQQPPAAAPALAPPRLTPMPSRPATSAPQPAAGAGTPPSGSFPALPLNRPTAPPLTAESGRFPALTARTPMPPTRQPVGEAPAAPAAPHGEGQPSAPISAPLASAPAAPPSTASAPAAGALAMQTPDGPPVIRLEARTVDPQADQPTNPRPVSPDDADEDSDGEISALPQGPEQRPGQPVIRMVGETDHAIHPASPDRQPTSSVGEDLQRGLEQAQPPAAPVSRSSAAVAGLKGLIEPMRLSPQAQTVWPIVATRKEDQESLSVLQLGVPALAKLVGPGNIATPDVIVLAFAHILLGAAEEARRLLVQLAAGMPPDLRDAILHTYQLLTDRFPSLVQAQRDRAMALEKAGFIDEAIDVFEQVARRDESAADRPVLERLYRRRADDPAIQFKLVKLVLRDNRLDEAIELLNILRQNESYQGRSLKILGLCYWQKGQRQEAWARFRMMPLSEELKDMVYRLALDMESAGEIKEAIAVYERLLTEAPDFRDATTRMKKLEYRLKLQEEERARSYGGGFTDERFTIIEELNRGSMGIIYKAKDKVLEEIVVLKVLNDYLSGDPLAVERFKREARAAKRLSHPNIVRIHDMFINQGKLFLSMEYIQGTDLKRLLSEQTHFPEDKVIRYFLQTCEALSYAHGLGIVHRDIKPANIMITRADTVKVTDFGIAKMLRQDDATKSGTAIIGTPLYMAPEQITGEGIDQRSDIYSLGIMVYELLAGNPPFYLGNIEYHHIHTSPPALPSHVTPKLAQIVMRCISKNPADRYQSVEEIFNDIKTSRGTGSTGPQGAGGA